MNAGHRRAALALSALAKVDRAWILANLSSEDRVSLAGLLSELRRQGIKVPPSELTAFLQDPPEIDEKALSVKPPLMPLQRLASMSADQLLRVLWCEPDWLVAIICGITQWRWLADFLSLLEEPRARQVQRYMRSQTVDNNAACEALVAAVVERITRGDGDDAFELEYRPLQRRKRESALGRLTSWLL